MNIYKYNSENIDGPVDGQGSADARRGAAGPARGVRPNWTPPARVEWPADITPDKRREFDAAHAELQLEWTQCLGLERLIGDIVAGAPGDADDLPSIPEEPAWAFEGDLYKCKTVWDVVLLLLEYGRSLYIRNVRYHRLNQAAQTLVFTACAGLSPKFDVKQLRLPSFRKHCRFLNRDESDSLWSFENEEPTLFRVDATAGFPLRSKPGLFGIPTVVVRREQCDGLNGIKGEVWMDFPFMFADRWIGKLSCDVDPADLNRPDFRKKVWEFWGLVKQAGVYLDRHATMPPVDAVPAASTVVAVGTDFPATIAGASFRDVSLEALKAALRYEATHGDLDNAAVAAQVSRMLQSYARQSIAIDGGETNIVIAGAIIHDVQRGCPTVGTIMTNNLGVLYRIPISPRFPVVEATGGKVRRKSKDKPPTMLPDDGLIKRIRSWRFAASVIGTSGIAPPHVLTGSGQENDVKRLFMNASTDVIIPVPSFKWGHISGRTFLDMGEVPAQAPAGSDPGNLFLVTVYPHEDASDSHWVRSQTSAIHGHFIDGVRVVSKLKNLVGIRFVKAVFRAEHGLHPTLSPIKDEDQDVSRLDELYRRVNPDRRADIRLIVCFQLARHSRVSLGPSKPADQRTLAESDL